MRGGAVFGIGSLVLEPRASVVSGVEMLSLGRTVSSAPTDSLLCALEKEGYGKLVFNSRPLDRRLVSESLMLGIDERLRESEELILILSSAVARSFESESLFELLRREVL